ncbi:hypothetical protein K0M31_017012 [Melipona bicolor]|uniref:Uncharacterized protein n=1 Tax=Melipona bicolor TaxID=60889 RepID=A0AA40KE76_9HYME|nr:hypothetical protein K0M31_017012 [Melipona bicolor]
MVPSHEIGDSEQKVKVSRYLPITFEANIEDTRRNQSRKLEHPSMQGILSICVRYKNSTNSNNGNNGNGISKSANHEREVPIQTQPVSFHREKKQEIPENWKQGKNQSRMGVKLAEMFGTVSLKDESIRIANLLDLN